jgi:ABC-type dipeptide/oligopeptide/nickel transport system permease subunit
MYNGTPIFVRLGRFGSRFSSFANGIGGWFLVAPGISLVLMGLAIIIWPALLAYMVASLFIGVGVTLALWGWRVARIQRQMHRDLRNRAYYQEQHYRSVDTSQDRF